MKFSTPLAVLAATLIAGASADFQIYYEEELVVNPTGDENTVTSIRVFDGEPSCDDVNSYAAVPLAADASSTGYSRCEGCGDTKDILDWDIEELEINAGGDWGHYTIYKGEGYKLTPADGGPLAGECTRDNGDTYDCTIAIANTHGTRLFTCKSDMGGIHGK